MPTYYLDTSAVIKNYHPEPGTQEVRRIVNEPDSQRVISRLTVTEVQRAFARRARQKTITANELKRLRGILYRDLLERRFRIERLWEFHYHTAVRVFLKYWPQEHVALLRTADAIQLAAALSLCDRHGLDYFVSADKDLCATAEAEQLKGSIPSSRPNRNQSPHLFDQVCSSLGNEHSVDYVRVCSCGKIRQGEPGKIRVSLWTHMKHSKNFEELLVPISTQFGHFFLAMCCHI